MVSHREPTPPHIGVNSFCVIKSTVKEVNKSQQNHKMFADLYIIALLSNW